MDQHGKTRFHERNEHREFVDISEEIRDFITIDPELVNEILSKYSPEEKPESKKTIADQACLSTKSKKMSSKNVFQFLVEIKVTFYPSEKNFHKSSIHNN